MSKKLYMTNADYVAIAISPALIMALVGSLVYFLIEVMYVGDYQARLNYAFALFVFAAVLIARISIEMGSEHATLYALPLGIAMFLVLVRFVEQPSPFSHVINLGLMGLVWWCAHKLTWDSTVIDDDEDASGEGLMQRIGVDDGVSSDTAGEKHVPAAAAAGTAENELLADDEATSSAAQRLWRALVRPRKGPHTPGMWVLYFSLAALPLFGIGQHWIPAAQVGRRRYAFTLLLVYVASALALLVTTSFLNLRRYLRQRRVEMPPVIAGTWVGVGMALIVIVMMLAMLIPRPGAEVAISRVPWQAVSPDGLSASRYAMNRDGGEEQNEQQNAPAGENASDQQAVNPQQPAGQQSGDQPQTSRQPGDDGKQSDSEAQSQSQGQSQGQSPSQNDNQKNAESNQGQSSDSADQSKEGGKSDDQGQAGKGAPNQDSSHSSAAPPRQEQREQRSQQQDSPSRPTSSPTNPLQNITSALGGLAGLVKILFYVLIALLLAWAVWKYRHQLMQALADILHQLKELFGGNRSRSDADEQDAPTTGPRPRSFAEFRDPFQSGEHRQMPPEELVRYTFAAFEAWANDRGRPRAQDCTPQEFVRIVLPPDSAMHGEARRLARLYSEAAYAAARTPREASNKLHGLWQMMRDAHTDEVARMA
jgi:hypothetical protein